LKQARVALANTDVKSVKTTLSEIEKSIEAAREISGENASEATMYRVLASMGLEQGAFIHEVNALSVLAQGVAQALEEISRSVKDQKLSRRLSAIAADARNIRERLRRNAIYLMDMTGIEGRRRRSRQDVLDRLNKVIEFHSRAISRREIAIRIDVPQHLRTPPMFPAEVSAIFTNLLSNAIKFAGVGGKIAVTARNEDGELVLKFENTGEVVNLARAGRWFEPFRSSTIEVDEALGHPMLHIQFESVIRELPRFHSVLAHPLDILEFTLMELFQEKWRQSCTELRFMSEIRKYPVNQRKRIASVLELYSSLIDPAKPALVGLLDTPAAPLELYPA
jgi:hypothetical protein